MLPFVQIAHAGYKQSTGEWPPYSLGRSDLSPIRRQSEIRIGPQIGGDLVSARLVYRYLPGE